MEIAWCNLLKCWTWSFLMDVGSTNLSYKVLLFHHTLSPPLSIFIRKQYVLSSYVESLNFLFPVDRPMNHRDHITADQVHLWQLHVSCCEYCDIMWLQPTFKSSPVNLPKDDNFPVKFHIVAHIKPPFWLNHKFSDWLIQMSITPSRTCDLKTTSLLKRVLWLSLLRAVDESGQWKLWKSLSGMTRELFLSSRWP